VLYIDTSVLLVYTLTQGIETERVPATTAFFDQITTGTLLGATSFYALQEVHIFAIENAPDFATGAAFGKTALEKILALPLLLVPLVSRSERKLHAPKFSALRDSSDVPHAIAASVYGCDAIVAYDEHFRAISHIIPYKTPDDFFA
jgi:predicted nucleic acid-binding protein